MRLSEIIQKYQERLDIFLVNAENDGQFLFFPVVITILLVVATLSMAADNKLLDSEMLVPISPPSLELPTPTSTETPLPTNTPPPPPSKTSVATKICDFDKRIIEQVAANYKRAHPRWSSTTFLDGNLSCISLQSTR